MCGRFHRSRCDIATVFRTLCDTELETEVHLGSPRVRIVPIMPGVLLDAESEVFVLDIAIMLDKAEQLLCGIGE